MRVDELERELRAERPEPDSEFARRLDDWAAAGFPRGGELDPRRRSGHSAAGARGAASGDRHRLAPLREPFARALDRLRSVPPRRVLAPAGAAATLFVVAAVAISQSDELGGGDDESAAPATSEFTAGGESAGAGEPAPVGEQDAAAAAEPAGPRRRQALGAPAATVAPDDRVTSIPPIPRPGDGGGIASGTDNRIVDATARLVLGAETGEVQDVANRVVEVTDRYDGIVSRSQVSSDQAGARATFELEIPFKRLDAALADLSELGDVVSRTEGGEDITARAVRARRALAETLEDIQQARTQLIRTDDPEQRRIIRSRIRFLDATADQQRAQLAGAHRQGRFATVGVDVTSDGEGAGDDGWSLGDAADDAVGVLTAVGGILLVSLAGLIPLVALAVAGWFAFARARRASRERALGPYSS